MNLNYDENAWKEEGLRKGKMFVLPTESFQDYVEHPLIRGLYLTDVGYYPRAKGHFRERKEGIEEYILLYCTEGRGTVLVDGKEYIFYLILCSGFWKETILWGILSIFLRCCL